MECQICGRQIKAKNGVIAHHGYTRPDSGWQTASCMGARYLPYELSNNRIQTAIDTINQWLQKRKSFLNDLLVNPPLEMSITQYGRPDLIVNKPEGFIYNHNKSIRPWSYESAFEKLKYETEKSIKSAKQDIIYLTDRLEKWEYKG